MNEFIEGLRTGIKRFGEYVSTIINAVLLFIVYIIGVGITSMGAKIFRKHFLDKEMSNTSYWSTLDVKKEHMERYYRQF